MRPDEIAAVVIGGIIILIVIARIYIKAKLDTDADPRELQGKEDGFIGAKSSLESQRYR